jgi:tryptophanyl-tRNA synthetase
MDARWNSIASGSTKRPYPMRYLSGIQPSGILHLGNWFGAMRQHIRSQEDPTNQCYYFIADYHSLTTVRDAQRLRQFVRETAIAYLAMGLDPTKVAFFRQSDVPQVLELAWVLSTVTPMGLLERCHSFKDKIARGIPADHGLFAYPVLMAADILIYDAHRVPVGRDQVQHVEVTRDIAQRFNHIYGDTLIVPDYQIEESTAVVPGIDGQKMSKSYDNTLELFATEKQLEKKIGRIVTDSNTVEDPKDPETNVIFQLYRLVATPAEVESMADRFRKGGYGYGQAKKELLRAVIAYFAPYSARYKELQADPGLVDSVLAEGAREARKTASECVERVYRACGLR